MVPQNSCMNLLSYSRNALSLTISAYLSYDYYDYFSATLEIIIFNFANLGVIIGILFSFGFLLLCLLISQSPHFELPVYILCLHFFWYICLFLTEIQDLIIFYDYFRVYGFNCLSFLVFFTKQVCQSFPTFSS